MKLTDCTATLSFFLLLCVSTSMRGQAKTDLSDSDVSALLRTIDRAHQERNSVLGSGDSMEKKCNKGKGWQEELPSEVCFYATMPQRAPEEAGLKGCYFPSAHSSKNPCVTLAQYYVETRRYIEALAAISLPNAGGADESALFWIRADAYGGLGNVAKQKEALHHLCDLMDDMDSCALLHHMGDQVDMIDALRRSIDKTAQDSAEEAQRQADAEQDQRERAAGRAATIAALSSIGAAPQTSAQAPIYRTAPSPSSPSYSPPSSMQSPQSCRDMTACVKVVSSTYDANHFLHVVVRNDCGSQIRITTSTYAQNLSCTMGQTAIFNPGDSEDMGSVTDRNWYQIQADDSVRSSVDGSGCKLVVANSCLDTWRR